MSTTRKMIECDGLTLEGVQLPQFTLCKGSFLRIWPLLGSTRRSEQLVRYLTGQQHHPAIHIHARVIDGTFRSSVATSRLSRFVRQHFLPLSARRYLRNRFNLTKEQADAVFDSIRDHRACRGTDMNSWSVITQELIQLCGAMQAGEVVVWSSADACDPISRDCLKERITRWLPGHGAIEVSNYNPARSSSNEVEWTSAVRNHDAADPDTLSVVVVRECRADT